MDDGRSRTETPRGTPHRADNGGDHTCTRCGAAFERESDLKNHVRGHVTNSPVAEHVCTICGAAFDTRPGLAAHEQIHMDTSLAA